MNVFYINYDDFDGRIDKLIENLDIDEEYYWLYSSVYGYPQESKFNFFNDTPVLRTKSEVLSQIKNDTFLWEGGLITVFKKDKDKHSIAEWGLPNATAFFSKLEYDCPLQHPLAEAEIFLSGQSGLVVKSNSDGLSKRFKQMYPNAQSGEVLREKTCEINIEQNKNKKQHNIFLTLIFSTLFLAVAYILNIVIFAIILEWDANEGFVPWGIISIVLLAVPIILIFPLRFCEKKRVSPEKSEQTSNEQIKNELGFLVQNGFFYKPYKIPQNNRVMIDVHRFEKDGYVVEVARSEQHNKKNNKKAAYVSVDFKCGVVNKDAIVLMKDLSQCSFISKSERDDFAFIMSRQRNIFSAGKNLLLKYIDNLKIDNLNINNLKVDSNTSVEYSQTKNIEMKIEDGEKSVNNSEVKSGNGEETVDNLHTHIDMDSKDDSIGEIGLPPEFYEMEVFYNKLMRKYKLISTIAALLLITGLYIIIAILCRDYMDIGAFIAIGGVIFLMTFIVTWNSSEIFLHRASKGLREIRKKQRVIFKNFIEKQNSHADNTPVFNMKPRESVKKPQSTRSIIPAIVFSATAVLLVALGALLKDTNEGLFALGIAMGVVMLLSTIAYMLNMKAKKAAILPSTAFFILVLPYFLAYFIVENKSIFTKAIGYSAATTFVCVALAVVTVLFIYLPKVKERKFLSRPEFLFIMSIDKSSHFIYNRNFRAAITFGKNQIDEIVFQKYEVSSDGKLIFIVIHKDKNSLQNIYSIAQKLLTFEDDR